MGALFAHMYIKHSSTKPLTAVQCEPPIRRIQYEYTYTL